MLKPRREVFEMSNKLGTLFTGLCGKVIRHETGCPKCGEQVLDAFECPDRLKDLPDGFIVYIDSDGSLQAMEEDPHDYR
jgi:ribosomal protein S27AE